MKSQKHATEGPIECIPNGVNTEEFQPRNKDAELLNELGLSTKDWIIAAPVRAEHVKGIDRILNVWDNIARHAPNSVLLIFGNGDAKQALQQQVIALGIEASVIFVGGVPKDRMSSFYNLSDICVMLSREEGGVPFSALESLSCGTPLIATRVGGLQDLETCSDGVILINDESELPAALMRFYGSTDAREQSAAKLHAWIEGTYASVRSGQRTIDVYTHALATRMSAQ